MHDLGIAEVTARLHQQEGVQYFDPQNPLDTLEVVVFQAEVQKLMTKGNQVVVVAKPQRYGLQILHLDKKRIRPANEDEALLFQMITPEGDEIDHAVF